MSKFRIFEKSPIFKKSNLTFKNFLKIEKRKFLNFLFFHLVVYSLRFPKWVYLSKSFEKFRSYIFICKSSHIFSIADLGLLSYSYASMCTGVLAQGCHKNLENCFLYQKEQLKPRKSVALTFKYNNEAITANHNPMTIALRQSLNRHKLVVTRRYYS